MKHISLLFLLFLGLPFLFTGCDKIPGLQKNWLVGTWVLDQEKTMEAFTRNNQRDTPVGGVAGELAAAAIRKSVEALISPMTNAKFIFTETEYMEQFAGNTAKPKTYEIVSRPGPDQIKTLDSNNVVNIYHREGEHIWYYLRGNEKAQIYLKPAL
jgi:hypothetical protein